MMKYDNSTDALFTNKVIYSIESQFYKMQMYNYKK